MKKLMLMLAALCLTGMFAASAFAVDASGLYLSGKFVYGYTKMDNVKAIAEYWSDDMGDKSDDAWGGALAVGYDFYKRYNAPIRAELEYAIFSKVEAKKTWVNYWVDKQKFDIQTLFINAYFDLHNKTNFTPYIGAGIGLAFIDTKYTAGGNYYPIESTSSKLRTNFAWQVGAGCAYNFTDNWSLDAGYRFVSLGKAKTGTSYLWNDSFIYAKAKNIYMHQFYAGVRYTF